MRRGLKIICCLVLISLTTSLEDLFSRPNTYVHPHQVYNQLKHLESLTNFLADERDEISKLLTILSPQNILDQVSAGSVNVSDTCANQTLFMLETLAGSDKSKSWATNMIDAWGKPGAGILRGGLQWLGNFDECIAVQSMAPYVKDGNSSLVATQLFQGQYCTVTVSIGSATISSGIPATIGLGSCFPSGCSELDIYHMLEPLLDIGNTSLAKSASVGCQETDMSYSAGAIVTIVLYCIMGSICIAGTVYDMIFIMMTPDEDDDVPIANGQAVDAPNENGHEEDTTPILISSVINKKNTERKHSKGNTID